MGEFKGTQGNWQYVSMGKNDYNVDVYRIDTEIGSVEGIAEVYGDINDAKLIAASPELLEALIKVRDYASEFGMRAEEWEAVANAITKATN